MAPCNLKEKYFLINYKFNILALSKLLIVRHLRENQLKYHVFLFAIKYDFPDDNFLGNLKKKLIE